MKHILISTHFFYPSITPRAFRATELADELARRGYRIDILIGESNMFINDYDVKSKKKLDKQSKNDTQINSNPSKLRLKKIVANALISFVGEINVIKKRKLFSLITKIDKYDSIISIGLPFYTHYHIYKLIRKNNWSGIAISDWGDPFYRSGDSNFMFPHMGLIQRKIFETFDYVTIPVEEAKSYYAKFVLEDKIKIIPQGFDFNVRQSDNNSIREELSELRKPIFIYAGAFYEYVRDPKKIFEFLYGIDDNFTFIIFTDMYGPIYNDVLLPAKKVLGEKLILCEKIPRSELLTYLRLADFVLNIENISENQIPSKLIDLSISGRPILSVNPQNIDAKIFKQFLHGDYNKSLEIELNEYKIENVTEKFINLIEEK